MAGQNDPQLTTLAAQHQVLAAKQKTMQDDLTSLRNRMANVEDVMIDSTWAIVYTLKYMGCVRRGFERESASAHPSHQPVQ